MLLAREMACPCGGLFFGGRPRERCSCRSSWRCGRRRRTRRASPWRPGRTHVCQAVVARWRRRPNGAATGQVRGRADRPAQLAATTDDSDGPVRAAPGKQRKMSRALKGRNKVRRGRSSTEHRRSMGAGVSSSRGGSPLRRAWSSSRGVCGPFPFNLIFRYLGVTTNRHDLCD